MDKPAQAGGQRGIRRLSPELADQIAAGEVIERPASVVKELVENSLDAGARHVEIQVEGGGVRLLRVRDDGQGIVSEELALALQRHATSKLISAHDLEHIQTLGFRGEALPSIASVSRLRLLSRPAGQRQAWEVRAEGGRIGSPGPAAGDPGTLVEVRDLFYNLPARRKFLRTDRTELLHVRELLRRLALGSPATAFSLRTGEQSALRLPLVREPRERIDKLFGRAFLEQAVAVRGEMPGMRLTGWACLPAGARAQADRQCFFLNRRALRDRNVQHALRTVYAERLGPGRHPCYVLYLEMDAGLVDVNVHPAKHEVRFREPRAVHDFIIDSLRPLTAPAGELFHMPVSSYSARPGANQVRELLRGYEVVKEASGVAPAAAEGAASPGARSPEDPGGLKNDLEQPFSQDGSHQADPQETPRGDAQDAPRVLGRVVGGRYLLASVGEDLLLVDYPAARRFLCLERLRRARDAGPLRTQPLLLPIRLAATASQLRCIEEWGAQLRDCGLLLQEAGPRELFLRELPAALQGVAQASLGAALLEALDRHGAEREESRRTTVLLEAVAAAMATATPDGADYENLLEELGIRGEAVETAPGRRGIWRRYGERDLYRLLKA